MRFDKLAVLKAHDRERRRSGNLVRTRRQQSLQDRLQGEGGDDTIISADGWRDVLKCGSGGETGGDTAIADEGDIVRGCEVVERG